MLGDFLINVQPSPLFPWFQEPHEVFKIFYHLCTDAIHETSSFRSCRDRDLPAVVCFVGTADVPQFLETLNQPGGGRRTVVHEFGDPAHTHGTLGAEVTQQEKLGKGNFTSGQFAHQTGHEASLHDHDHTRQQVDFPGVKFPGRFRLR